MVAKATDTFERKQRKSLEQLEEANLFTLAPRLTCALLASPVGDHVFQVGEKYRLLAQDGLIVVVSGVVVIGRVPEPPRSVVDLFAGPVPSACGRIAAVSGLSGDAEIVLE
jgi:hypothetical protein